MWVVQIQCDGELYITWGILVSLMVKRRRGTSAKQARASKSKVAKCLECLPQNQCIHARLCESSSICNTVLWAEVIMQNERPKVYDVVYVLARNGLAGKIVSFVTM